LLIIFDLDDTLIDTSGCMTPIKLEDALREVVNAGLILPDFAAALEQIKRIDAGAMSSKEAFAEFLEIHHADPKYLAIATRELYESFSHDLPIFTFDGVLETLKNLAEVHRLALVTAGFPDYQLWKLKKTGIDSSFFSKIVVCEPGHKKTHYKQVVDELGVSRGDVIVCGDRVDKDLSPAKDLGFRTIHIRKGRGKRYPSLSDDIDYSINEFCEISEVIASASLMNFLSS
jgi:putative hydrolase of the HAD superfamily